MRLLITGSRTWSNERFMIKILDDFIDDKEIVLIHGDAPGADKMAADILSDFDYINDNLPEDVKTFPIKIEAYPADWNKYGKAAGPIRNQEMLDSGIDYVLAFFDKPEDQSRGTKDMVERCKKAGIPGKKFFLYDEPI